MLKKLYILFGASILVMLLLFFAYAMQNGSFQKIGNAIRPAFLTSSYTQPAGQYTLNGNTESIKISTKDLGEISPMANKVTLEKKISTIQGSSLRNEYIVIKARKQNTQPINISNWSLQSMVTKTWIGIPKGASNYTAGTVNALADIYLAPGESAIIATGESPVGVSFRENSCSGFLGNTQKFTPRLTSVCINPKSILPPTIENVRTYGGTCITTVAQTPRCSYITNTTIGFSALSAQCKAYIQPRLTYNNCVGSLKNKKGFYSAKEWRIFLNQPHRIWKDNYEVIRLLDAQNKTVDVFSY